MEDEVAMGERAALGVLAGEPHRDPVLEQRGVGERLGLPPVDATVGDRNGAGAASVGLACFYMESIFSAPNTVFAGDTASQVNALLKNVVSGGYRIRHLFTNAFIIKDQRMNITVTGMENVGMRSPYFSLVAQISA